MAGDASLSCDSLQMLCSRMSLQICTARWARTMWEAWAMSRPAASPSTAALSISLSPAGRQHFLQRQPPQTMLPSANQLLQQRSGMAQRQILLLQQVLRTYHALVMVLMRQQLQLQAHRRLQALSIALT